MQQYADTEQLAVDEKKKRLHYERIRITEDREEIKQQRSALEKLETEIDDKALEYFKIAVQKYNFMAHIAIGHCYHNKQEYNSAIFWLRAE